ncbi:MAG: T9SS type A sorting domain-containing protein [Bacteroidota bacterium]
MKNFYSFSKSLILAMIFGLLGFNQAFAQPANDNCANAISLTVNGACVNGVTDASTVQTGESFCAGTINQSVWYKFVATQATHIVTMTGSGGCYMGSAVYSGACLPATRLTCVAAAEQLLNQRHSLSGLTVGATYLIQIVYSSSGPCGSGADFCVAVTTGVDDPTGCLCADLSTSVSGNCHSLSLVGATGCIDSGGCEVAGSGDAILMVRPTASPMVITIGNLGSNFTGDVQVMIYSGNNCGALISVGTAICGAASPTFVVSQAVTVGTKYWIFVSSADGSVGVDTEYGICVGNGSACAITGCGAAPLGAPGNAYGVSALDATVVSSITSSEIYATGGTAGGNGFKVASNGATTYTNTAFTNTLISNYPLITVENINCFNTNIDFTAVDPTPLWPMNGLGTNATSLTTGSSATLTVPDNRYTATVGRRTINFQGDITTRSSSSFSNTTDVAIADENCASGGVNSTITVAGATGTVASGLIQVQIDVTHVGGSYMDVFLRAPNGQILELTTDNGTISDNFTATVFTDVAAASAASGVCPMTGSFRPEGSLTASCTRTPTVRSFGEFGTGGNYNPNGVWTLYISSDTKFATGTLLGWSITFPDFPAVSANQNVNYPDFVNMLMGIPGTGTLAGVNKVCPNVGNSYSSSLIGVPGMVFSWTASTSPVSSNTATFAAPDSAVTDVFFANGGITTLTYVLTLTVSSGCCGPLTPVLTYSVQVLPDPAPATVPVTTFSVCTGGSVTLNATPVSSYTYGWYDAALGGNLLGLGASYVVTYATTGVTTYYVELVNDLGCPSVRVPVTVTGVNNPPAVTNISMCVGGAQTLRVNNPLVPGAYTWYQGSCGGPVVSNSFSYAANITASETFYVSSTPTGCAETTCTPFVVTLNAISPPVLTWTGAGVNSTNNWFDPSNWRGLSDTQNPASFTSGAINVVVPQAVCTSPGTTSTITVTGVTSVNGITYAIPTNLLTVTVNVTVSSATKSADLTYFLIAPNGDIVKLTQGLNRNYTNVSYSDQAPAVIAADAVTYVKPNGTLTAKCGTTPNRATFGAIGGGSIVPNGDWTLRLNDDTDGGGSSNTIVSWSISFPEYLNYSNCVPGCASDVIIPNTPALAVSNPPKIGFSTTVPAVNSGIANTGNLYLNSGNVISFTSAAARLNICGDFVHAGTLITNDLGRVSFVGTVPQTYTNTTTVTTVSTLTNNSFNFVTINNTALNPTVTVVGNMTIGNMVGHTKGTLQFLSGRLVLSTGNRLTMANRTAAIITGTALDKYVVTSDPTAVLRRYLATAGGSYDFPVGNIEVDSYQLQNLNFASGHGIDYIDVNFSNSASLTGGGLPLLEATTIYTYTSLLDNGGSDIGIGNANGGVWTVTPNTAGTATYTCTLNANNYTIDAATTRTTVLKRVTSPVGSWTIDGTYASGGLPAAPGTQISAVRSGMVGFSQFAIGKSISIIPLPVKLAELTATCNDDVITVKWSTSSEKAASTFTLEKSNNGREYTEVRVVKAAGTSNVEQYYSAVDSKPFEGTTYYRLKIIDQNGMIDYTKVIEAVSPCVKGNETFYIFPNPARTEAKVVFTAASAGVAIVKVKNAVGQEVILNKVETVVGENTCNLNLNGFATGVYMVSVTMNEETQTGKLVVNNR